MVGFIGFTFYISIYDILFEFLKFVLHVVNEITALCFKILIMGRKRDLTQIIKSGPGKKSKKQPPPTFPGLFTEGMLIIGSSGSHPRATSSQISGGKSQRGLGLLIC